MIAIRVPVVPPLVLVLALLAAALPARASAQTASAADLAGLREFVDASGAADSARLTRLVTERFAPGLLGREPVEQHVGRLLRLGRTAGGWDAVEPGDAPAPAVSLKARERATGMWIQFEARLEAMQGAGARRFAAFGLRPTTAPARYAEPRPSDAELGRKLDAYLRRLADQDRFAGAALVAKGGRVLYRGAFGPALRGWNIPNRPDTKFNLGSMNKMFTAVAIAQLVEQGKLSYEDPIGRYIPDWVRPDVGRTVRIKHLLSHTSGLGDYFTPEWERSSRALYRTVADYKPLVQHDSLRFEPGSAWSYSNTGFLLLGAIVERVTGQSYFDYVRERIFRPAGMTNTECASGSSGRRG